MQRVLGNRSPYYRASYMKTKALRIFVAFSLSMLMVAPISVELVNAQSAPPAKIPARSEGAMTGSEFARYTLSMDRSDREEAILDQLLKGNFPGFLRRLKPVRLAHTFEDGKTTTATLFVMPDYLSIGSDRDFFLIPMTLYTATRIAMQYGFLLPTKKIVDAIFEQSAFHFVPEPMKPGDQMVSTAYFLRHNEKIKKQRLNLFCPLGALLSGHKKDVVVTNRLAHEIGKIAIYGWHRLTGIPIQPLSTVHDATYADYSHGIRLVSDVVLIDQEPKSLYSVLEDPRLAKVVSDEGPIRSIRQMMTPTHQ